MIRMSGVAVLGLVLNTCPFTPAEEPDGYATVIGRVALRDGSPFTGGVHVSCWNPPETELSFYNGDQLDWRGTFELTLRAPPYSRRGDDEPFEFLCKVQSGPRGAAFAVRYVTVPFSADRAGRPITRVDLREGEIEPGP
jgi:hypothetical protein